MIRPPLQIVSLWLTPPGTKSTPQFIEAAERAFRGSTSVGGMNSTIPSWIAGAELQSVSYRSFSRAPAVNPADILDSALHTLVVACVDEALWDHGKEVGLDGQQFMQWLGKAWEHIDDSDGRHGLLLGVPDERLRHELADLARTLGCSRLGDCQMRTNESLGEEAARPAVVAVRALETARDMLNQGLGHGERPLQLFVSHAKVDGLGLAESLRHSIGRIAGLQTYYDARDIKMGSNWKKALQKGVESSVLLAIRTDQYDCRPFCVQEVAWADAVGVPIVVVEARSSLFHPPSLMALEASPWVRVPDGSITRIVYCALRENIRPLLARRGIHELTSTISSGCEVLPRSPTWDSLDGALKRLATNTAAQKYVVYPDPQVPSNTAQAMDTFVGARDKQTRVVHYSWMVEEYA